MRRAARVLSSGKPLAHLRARGLLHGRGRTRGQEDFAAPVPRGLLLRRRPPPRVRGGHARGFRGIERRGLRRQLPPGVLLSRSEHFSAAIPLRQRDGVLPKRIETTS